MAMSAVPKTYRDAITITRELGPQYLWIDSLCILQDDAADWEHEVARMASVYEGAHFTIAAAWGKSGESGCFHVNHPSMAIEVQNLTTSKGLGSTRGSTVRLYLRPFPNQRRCLREASLNSRAWTLQEVILSRRTIFFAEDQLYWYCTSLYESEDRLEFCDNMLESAHPLPSLGLIIRQPDMPLYELYACWQTTMQNYSARSLTRRDDKLAALAGVTQLFQRAVDDIPLAGLWKNDICKGLLWKVPPATHGKLDSETIQALNIPSWSWLKGRSLIQMEFFSVKPCVEISSVSVSWTGLRLTSKIAHASITGRGKIIPILNVDRNDDETCLCRAQFRCAGEPFNKSPRYRREFSYFDECTTEIEDALSCLLIWIDEKKDRRRADAYDPEITALIVTAVPSSDSASTYRLVGVRQFDEFPLDIYDNIPEADFTLI